MSQVLMAGGGTGGHLFPGLALAEALQEREPQVRIAFVGTPNGLEQALVPPAGFPLTLIQAGRGAPLSWRKPTNAPRFLLGFVQSLALIRRLRPRVVVALGGFAAAAPGVAARCCGVPLVVLEQNTVPGRTNRTLARWARQVHLQFAEARGLLAPTRGQILDSGSPIRQSVAALAEADPVRGPALLVLGGSQGAERLNALVLGAVGPVVEATGCEVIHVAGAANEASVRDAYEDVGVAAEVHGFALDMAGLYCRARLVVSRAGAGSLAEFAAAGLPAVLVPLPEAKDDHQLRNAASVSRAGGALVQEQADLSAEALARSVIALWQDEGRRRTIAAGMRRTARPRAAQTIAAAMRPLLQ